ncbi:MAG: dihydroorotase, partial [Actinobacteria bacterium]|nr:dihydroorotase [Actinomycetota bacterium]
MIKGDSRALRFDLVIRGGTVVSDSCFKKVDIGITDGLISALVLQGNLPTNDGQKEIDAAGKFVIPGVVDSHVHLREPGFTEKED